MLRPLLYTLSAAALVATMLAPRPAHAESAPAPPRCRVRILPNGGKVTANIPAFVLDDTSSPGLTATVTLDTPLAEASLALDAISDPRTPGVTLFVPKTKGPLEVGTTHSLGYTVKCSNPGPFSLPNGTLSFVTTAAVALPTRIGSVRELADGRAVITPSAELAAYLETTRFDTFLDGQPAGSTRYGVASGADLDVAVSTFYLSIGGAPTDGGRPPVCKNGAGVEKHELKLVAHVAGAETDPDPLTLPVSVDCSSTPSSTSLPDGGGDDRGASGGDGSGGCAVSGSGSLGRITMFFGIGAGLAILLRRRTRRLKVR